MNPSTLLILLRPRTLPIPGFDLENVFLLRDPSQANKIAEHAIGKNVVVIGTSFIGMNSLAVCITDSHDSLTKMSSLSVSVSLSLTLYLSSLLPLSLLLLKGMEVTAYLSEKASSISCIDITAVPFERVLGARVGKMLQAVSVS